MVNTNEDQIRSYVDRCFKDGMMKCGRDGQDDHPYDFYYILVKSIDSGIWIMKPFIYCRYMKVKGYVNHRLRYNLMKNFGIHYGDHDELKVLTYMKARDCDIQIDPNYCRAVFNFPAKKTMFSLSIFDNHTMRDWDLERGGKYANENLEKLVMTYYNATKQEVDTKELRLPDEYGHDWDKFQQLYYDTFKVPIGSEYEIICSKGIERLQMEVK